VVGWQIKYNAVKKCCSYNIEFQRLESEPPMGDVLKRPVSDELDDYKEYKRLRQIARASKNQLSRARPLGAVTEVVPSISPNDFGPHSGENIDYFNLPMQPTRQAETPFVKALRASIQGPTSPSRLMNTAREPSLTYHGW